MKKLCSGVTISESLHWSQAFAFRLSTILAKMSLLAGLNPFLFNTVDHAVFHCGTAGNVLFPILLQTG